VVGGVLVPFSMLLEGLQALTPHRLERRSLLSYAAAAVSPLEIRRSANRAATTAECSVTAMRLATPSGHFTWQTFSLYHAWIKLAW
jgi:hypothetical protein